MYQLSQWNGLDAVIVKNEFAEGVVTLLGGQVNSYKPAGKEEVLWLSKKAWYTPGKPIRGGIPVCWPWFGPVPEPPHGFARISLWTFVSAKDCAEGTVVKLSFTPDVPAYAQLTAEIEVTFGKSLKVSLTTYNNGSKAYELTNALHTYFAIDNIRTARVLGYDGLTYADRVQVPSVEYVQKGDILFTEETDRIYETDKAAVIDDGKRRIETAKAGSKATVVWNPWIAKSKKLVDFDDEEYPGMLCVESTNAGKDVILLEPGAHHTLTTIITHL